jgi:endoglucanase
MIMIEFILCTYDKILDRIMLKTRKIKIKKISYSPNRKIYIKSIKPSYTLSIVGVVVAVVAVLIVSNTLPKAALANNISQSGSSTLAANDGTNTTNSQTTDATAGSGTTTSTSPSVSAATSSKSSGSGTATASQTTISTISSADSLYAYPDNNVATQASLFAQSNPSDSSAMLKLASEPMAEWFVDNNNTQANVNSYVSAASAAGKIPELVAYYIPERDCGNYSSGGATSSADYENFISSFAAGIGNRQAIVILEPDALAGMDCLSSSDQQTRVSLIKYAVQTISSQTNAAIYIDAGNPNWQPASVMAQRLTEVGISQVAGFSLNVSNFYSTASNVAYGTQLSQLIGGKHFVIDTSRNGNGPTSDDQWCNPAGMAFGNSPTLNTGNSLVDGYLWIKNPGESDGNCGPDEFGYSAPTAGAWWPQYVLDLDQDSGW